MPFLAIYMALLFNKTLWGGGAGGIPRYKAFLRVSYDELIFLGIILEGPDVGISSKIRKSAHMDFYGGESTITYI